ncbi:putative HAD superfamily phosphohydrolase YqeG [Paenibacillus sp. V4I3]|nr:putative HAD superfamily phosphohydrolase YqeG [Paenibacillus sp. V4I3]MDQ0885346.1 putative HAD superfamily phosphohydrolase YqeG [Paenibacillus sp. V4I9]
MKAKFKGIVFDMDNTLLKSIIDYDFIKYEMEEFI